MNGGKNKDIKEIKREIKKKINILINQIKYFEIILEPYLDKIEEKNGYDDFVSLPITKNKLYIYI
jgi:hypothetical protein